MTAGIGGDGSRTTIYSRRLRRIAGWSSRRISICHGRKKFHVEFCSSVAHLAKDRISAATSRRRDQARVWFGPVVSLSGCLVVSPVVWLSVSFVVWLASQSEIQPCKDANQLSTASPTASHSLNTHHPRDPCPAPEPHPHPHLHPFASGSLERVRFSGSPSNSLIRSKEAYRTEIEGFLAGFGSMAKDDSPHPSVTSTSLYPVFLEKFMSIKHWHSHTGHHIAHCRPRPSRRKTHFTFYQQRWRTRLPLGPRES